MIMSKPREEISDRQGQHKWSVRQNGKPQPNVFKAAKRLVALVGENTSGDCFRPQGFRLAPALFESLFHSQNEAPRTGKKEML